MRSFFNYQMKPVGPLLGHSGGQTRSNSFQDQTHFNGEGPRPKDYSPSPHASSPPPQNRRTDARPREKWRDCAKPCDKNSELSADKWERETLERFYAALNISGRCNRRQFLYLHQTLFLLYEYSFRLHTCHMCPFSQLYVNKSLNKRLLLMSSQPLSGRADHLNKADRDVSSPHAICWPLGDNCRSENIRFSHIFSRP